jgi:hypothetical protein
VEAKMLEVAISYLPHVYELVSLIYTSGALVATIAIPFFQNKDNFISTADDDPECKRALGFIILCGFCLTELASVSRRVGPNDVLMLAVPALALAVIAIHFAIHLYSRTLRSTAANP